MAAHEDMRRRHQGQIKAYIKANGFHASDGTQFIEGIEKLQALFERDVVKMVGPGLYMLAGRVDGYNVIRDAQSAERREVSGTDDFRPSARTTYMDMMLRHDMETKRYLDTNSFTLSGGGQLRDAAERLDIPITGVCEISDGIFMPDDKTLYFGAMTKAQQLQVCAGLDDRDFAYEFVASNGDRFGHGGIDPDIIDFKHLVHYVIPGLTGMSADEVETDPRINDALRDYGVVLKERNLMDSRCDYHVEHLSPPLPERLDCDETLPELEGLVERIMDDESLHDAFDTISDAVANAIVNEDYGPSRKARFLGDVQRVISKDYSDAAKEAGVYQRLAYEVFDGLKDQVKEMLVPLKAIYRGYKSSIEERDYLKERAGQRNRVAEKPASKRLRSLDERGRSAMKDSSAQQKDRVTVKDRDGLKNIRS